MAKILIPTPLRQFTGGADSVEVAGATVGEILSSLTTSIHPQRLCQRRGHPVSQQGLDGGERH
jgi:molybdopterin converting factor small subunit